MADTAKTAGFPVGYGDPGGASPGRRGGTLLVVGSGILFCASVALLGLYYAEVRKAERAAEDVTALTVPEPTPESAPLEEALAAATGRTLERPVTLSFDGKTFATTWKALGVAVDEGAVRREAARLAKEGTKPAAVDEAFLDARQGRGEPLPVSVDNAVALEALVGYKDSYDRPATDARLDLEKRQVQPEQAGYGIDVYESLAVLEEKARAGVSEVPLAGEEIRPSLTQAALGDIDISHVMGWFETKYAPGDKDRNYNLKVAAEKVNGHIMMPGQVFSFNEVVGDRTEKEGYRVAHVIQSGEMIDGLAGGTCQISSTLHGAAWFAGLDIVYAIPHSRPSTYITMGLDATVVYPTTDVKLRNPYDFPVAIRYVVAQGTVRVEILGKERPWDKIAFEREVKKENPYETITREDPTMPVGSSVVEQMGFPGYELIRRRHFYKDGKIERTEKWNIRYPPTTEFVRIGINPDPNLPPPKPQKHKGPSSPGKDKIWRMYQ